jgi:membrane-associated protease RseP (regulator of RpoE activity)
VLLVGVLLAWGVHVGAQRLVQSRIPDTKWLLQHRSGIAGFVDPFSSVAAVLGPASAGWTPPVEWGSFNVTKGRKRPMVTLLLAGPVANLVVGFGVLVGFDRWVGKGVAGAFDAIYRGDFGGFVDFAQVDTLGLLDKSGAAAGTIHLGYAEHSLMLLGMVQLLVGVISLIPLPPLEGGRLLFLFTPRSIGWQKAEYQLAERNIGVIIVLLCLIRISSGIVPPFGYLADVIAHGLAVLSTHV